jgi:hypothetical protein
MMRLAKILLVAVSVLLILPSAAISLTIGWRPSIGPKARALTDRKFVANDGAPGARAVYL